MGGAGGHLRGRRGTRRLRPDPDADVRGHGRVPAGWARAPTSSARRCTTSPTRAAATSALRPEGTASVVRAFVQHRPTASPWKVWYAAPSFRYERAQANRYRQHHQVGVEAIGSPDPDLDVEVIALLADFYRRARAAPGRPGAQLDRHAGRPRRLRRPAAGVPARPGSTSWRPTTATRSRAIRCGCSTRSGRPARRSSADAPLLIDSLSPRGRGPLRPGAGRSRPRPASRFRIDPAWCGASTTTRTPRSSSSPAALGRRPEHDRRRRPLRRSGRVARRAAHARHRLRLGHRARAGHLRRRGRVRRA